MLVARVSVARSTRSRGGGTRPTIATTETGRSFPPSPEGRRVFTRVAPRADSTTAHVSGLAGTRPDRPLRSLAPSGSPFTRCSLAVPGLAPRRDGTSTGPMLSWDLRPSGAFSTAPRVRSIAKQPGEPDSPGRPHLAPEAERGASILRPRPSESDGCVRVAARNAPTADIAHVRAPSRRRPCLSCPCRREPRRIAMRDAGLQRSEGYGGGSISRRPTSSFRVVRLLDVRAR